MASICFSSTTTVRPMELKISRASVVSSAVALGLAAMAVMPWRIRQGVLGMARMAWAGRPSSRSISAVVTDAAAEMITASLRSTFLTSWIKPLTCWAQNN